MDLLEKPNKPLMPKCWTNKKKLTKIKDKSGKKTIEISIFIFFITNIDNFYSFSQKGFKK